MKSPVRVAITGAAGQISYSLIFRIAAGDMLGKDQPVIIQLLEIPPAMNALAGVVMELNDCAFPLVAGIVTTDDPNVAFKDAEQFNRLIHGDKNWRSVSLFSYLPGHSPENDGLCIALRE